jgi:hypothetical protein
MPAKAGIHAFPAGKKQCPAGLTARPRHPSCQRMLASTTFFSNAESKRFFFEKKKQKTSAPAGPDAQKPTPPANKKFFASFLQKRSAFLA